VETTSRIKTTGVGSYPVLPWMVGNPSRLVLRDAMMAVLKAQELAGRRRFQAAFPPSELATVSINFFTARTDRGDTLAGAERDAMPEIG
jgi:hypothetical protein